MFPGSITPFNVWDLPIYMWQGFAQAADDHIEAMKER